MRNIRKYGAAALWALIAVVPLLFLTLVTPTPATQQLAAALARPESLAGLLFVGAIGKASDFVIYQEEFHTGMVESVTQFLGVFNEGSRGAIRLVTNALRGHYGKAAFFKDVSGLVSRRDITSTAAATILPMTQDEQISVKLNRKTGPVAQTLDALKKASMTEAQASAAFGRLAGQRKIRDMVNSAIMAGEAAIAGTAALNLDVSAETTPTATVGAMARGLALFGDASQSIVCFVAHSKPHFDLVGSLISANVTGLTDIATIQGNIPAYLGRPVVVTDSAALVETVPTPDEYVILGLVAGAIVVEESEDDSFYTAIQGGGENLYRLWQAENAYNVSVLGYKWDVTNGGTNPLDATLGTSTNWDLVASDNRLTAGFRIVSQ